MNGPHTFTIMTFHPMSPASFLQQINTASASKSNSHAIESNATARNELGSNNSYFALPPTPLTGRLSHCATHVARSSLNTELAFRSALRARSSVGTNVAAVRPGFQLGTSDPRRKET